MSSYARTAIVLGLLAAVGPFAIDMYLPAMPTIAADLGASTAATQMTLMAFFIAFGLLQMVYGPVSDMAGRKAPLYFGLALFNIGSAACAVAPSIEWLIAGRVVQGIGASAVMVIPRAIVRDMYTGVEATRLMSLVMLVFSVSPILAPLAGSALIVPFGWRSVFIAVTAVGALSIVLLFAFLPETHPAEKRIRVSTRALSSAVFTLLRHKQFLGLTFIGGLGMSSFFSFLGTSSFVYIDHYGLTPTQYSLAFSVNAIGFIGASQFAAYLGQRFGMARVVLTCVTMFAFFALANFAVAMAGVDSLAVLMVLLFCSFAFLGLVIPTTMVLALDEHGPIAGVASALGGTLQMLLGGLLIVVLSQFGHDSAVPMLSGIAGCATGAFILSRLTLRRAAAAGPLPQAAE